MTTVVRAGTFIDGTGADPKRDVTIHIEGDGITKIGGEPPRDATGIDATTRTVMPGMIDCHVHLMSSQESLEERIRKPFSLGVAQAFQNAKTTLDHGFTTVRDAGGTPLGVKMAIERGLVPGPRVRISVGALSQTGGHGDSWVPSGIVARAEHAEMAMTVADGAAGTGSYRQFSAARGGPGFMRGGGAAMHTPVGARASPAA